MQKQALIPISATRHGCRFLRLVHPPVKHQSGEVISPSSTRSKRGNRRAYLSRADPAGVYLATLQPPGRRAMQARLRTVARLLGMPLEEVRWAGLRFEIVIAIRSLMLEMDYSPSSINSTLSALKGAARAAWHLKQMKAEVYQAIRDVRGVKGSRLPRGRSLSPEELTSLFIVCAGDPTPAGRRDAALLAILCGCGARRGEIPRLSMGDYDARSGRLKVRGKGNKERLVYLKDRGARKALAEWLRLRGTAPGPLLCSVSKSGSVSMRSLSDQAVYNAVLKRARQANLSSFSPHDLRRTLLSQLLDKSRDPAAVQSWAGHASMTTTKIYDRRGEAALKRVAGLVQVPYASRRKKR